MLGGVDTAIKKRCLQVFASAFFIFLLAKNKLIWLFAVGDAYFFVTS